MKKMFKIDFKKGKMNKIDLDESIEKNIEQN